MTFSLEMWMAHYFHEQLGNGRHVLSEGPKGVKWELGFAFFRGWEMGFCALGLRFMKQKQ